MRSNLHTWLRVAVLIITAIVGVTSVASQPRFATVHWVDVLQLLGAGACFGVAITIIGYSRLQAREQGFPR